MGIGGVLITDRLLGNNYGDRLRDRFEHALETEFTDPNGSILPIRSELTGFTVHSHPPRLVATVREREPLLTSTRRSPASRARCRTA